MLGVERVVMERGVLEIMGGRSECETGWLDLLGEFEFDLFPRLSLPGEVLGGDRRSALLLGDLEGDLCCRATWEEAEEETESPLPTLPTILLWRTCTMPDWPLLMFTEGSTSMILSSFRFFLSSAPEETVPVSPPPTAPGELFFRTAPEDADSTLLLPTLPSLPVEAMRSLRAFSAARRSFLRNTERIC